MGGVVFLQHRELSEGTDRAWRAIDAVSLTAAASAVHDLAERGAATGVTALANLSAAIARLDTNLRLQIGFALAAVESVAEQVVIADRIEPS